MKMMLCLLSLLLSLYFFNCDGYITVNSIVNSIGKSSLSSSSYGLRSNFVAVYMNGAANTDVTSNADVNIDIDIKTSNSINEYVGSNYDNDDYYDDENPYDDLLNLNKKASTKSIELVKEATINPDTLDKVTSLSYDNDDNSGLIASSSISDRSKRNSIMKFTNMKGKLNQKLQWDHWDPFMEAELGDIDAEPVDNDKWILEMRDIVEQKRGYAIWSKRSDQEIKKATQKGIADKAMFMPPSVTLVITSVYVERTHTMKQLRKDNELACIEFRKWMIEQRKKTKKDPLPMAKIAVTKKWLLKHPKSSFKYSIGQKGVFNSNDVVLDEQIKPVEGVTFSTQDTAVAKGPTASGSPSPSNSSTKSQLHTVSASMRDWDKQKEEIIDVPVVMSLEKKGTISTKNFEIDGVEMFIANNPVDDYFVVL